MITIIGGGFTRSWLSLPLSHGTKVKGGKNPMLGVWFIPPIPVAVGPAQLPAAFPTVHRCLSIQGWHRPLFLPYRMGKSSCGPGIPFFYHYPVYQPFYGWIQLAFVEVAMDWSLTLHFESPDWRIMDAYCTYCCWYWKCHCYYYSLSPFYK